MSRKLVLAGVLLVALLAAQQIAGADTYGRFAQGLHNGMHGCWFSVVTYLVLQALSAALPALPPRRILAIGAGIALLLAPGTEAVQLFTGRDAGVGDVLFDLMGSGAALTVWSVRERMLAARLGLTIAALLLGASLWPLIAALSVNAYRDTIAPDLLRPGSPYYTLLFHSSSEVSQVNAPDGWAGRQGQRVLRIDLAEQRFPGAWISETVEDWRPYRTLMLEVFVAGDTALPLTVSVRFQKFREEHVYRTFEVGPGAGLVTMPLEGLFDREARRVSDLVIYSRKAFAGRSVYLGAIRLE